MIKTGRVVLVVDDEIGIREAVEDSFRRQGYEVVGADGGHQAFELIQSRSFDVVVSDIRMPAGDGIELLQKVTKDFPNLPVFLITGFTNYSTADLRALGAREIFSKPFKISELMEKVRNALQ